MAVGICGDPDLLFLDEPTTGFDPGARRQAWAAIRGLRDEGKTILLTTHFMDEAQALADRLAIMRAGEIVAMGTIDEIQSARRIGDAHPLRARRRRRAAARHRCAADRKRSGGGYEVWSDAPVRAAAPTDRLGARSARRADRPVRVAAQPRGHVPRADRRVGRAERAPE